MNLDLKLAIIKAYYSQANFANHIGITQSVLSNIVRGHRKLPKKTKESWAKELGVNVEDIFMEG